MTLKHAGEGAKDWGGGCHRGAPPTAFFLSGRTHSQAGIGPVPQRGSVAQGLVLTSSSFGSATLGSLPLVSLAVASGPWKPPWVDLTVWRGPSSLLQTGRATLAKERWIGLGGLGVRLLTSFHSVGGRAACPILA